MARALIALGADAAASPLPLGPERLSDPSAFGALLRRGACGPHALRGTPRSVVATGVESPSSNCRNTVFDLAWEGAAGPPSVFVKQPCADFATRLFANVIGFWKIECAFCRNLAPDAPIAMPRIHAVAEGRSRFAIVMEDLRARPGARLFVNRDLLEGVEPERAERCLRTLARLHAGFEGTKPEARERALPLDLHPFLSPSRAPVNLAVNRLAVKPCGERAGDVFDPALAALYRRALDHWEALTGVWYREPLTLVHGDSHLGNFFEAGGGDAMGMIDFQGAHWSRGIRDVQYFLIHSMRPERLAACERDLVAAYCEERTRLGAPLSADEGLDQYRGFSFQSLMTAVVSLGLGSFTDSDAVVRAMLERSVAAVRRVDFAGWLEARISAGP